MLRAYLLRINQKLQVQTLLSAYSLQKHLSDIGGWKEANGPLAFKVFKVQ